MYCGNLHAGKVEKEKSPNKLLTVHVDIDLLNGILSVFANINKSSSTNSYKTLTPLRLIKRPKMAFLNYVQNQNHK